MQNPLLVLNSYVLLNLLLRLAEDVFRLNSAVSKKLIVSCSQWYAMNARMWLTRCDTFEKFARITIRDERGRRWKRTYYVDYKICWFLRYISVILLVMRMGIRN